MSLQNMPGATVDQSCAISKRLQLSFKKFKMKQNYASHHVTECSTHRKYHNNHRNSSDTFIKLRNDTFVMATDSPSPCHEKVKD